MKQGLPPSAGRTGPAPGGGAPNKFADIARMIEAGHYDAALAVLKQRGLLNSLVGQVTAGNIYMRRGEPEAALRLFDGAARLAPDAPELSANRSAALMELGRYEEALAAADKALRLRPAYAGAQFNRGNALRALSRVDQAVVAYTSALSVQPGMAQAHLNRGLALLSLQRLPEALDDFTQATRLAPGNAAAHIARATALRQLARFDEALAVADAGLAIHSGNIDGLRLRFDLLYELERDEEALAAAEALVRLDATDTDGLADKTRALLKLGRASEARITADRLVALVPNLNQAYLIQAAVLADLGEIEESLTVIERARELGAPEGEYFRTRAAVLAAHGDPREAMADFERALREDVERLPLYRNRANLRIAIGDWPGGWDDYEQRLEGQKHRHQRLIKDAPKWSGETLLGKRLLMYGEQGLGDQLQFVRYVPYAIAAGADVTLVVDEALRSLFAMSFPQAEVVSELSGGIAGFDYQISLMSMPAARRETLATLPHQVPYLAADPARVAKWRERIKAHHQLRVGIIWQGNKKYPRDLQRSIPLRMFAPLTAVPNVHLYSLQARSGLQQFADLPDEVVVTRLGDEVENNPEGLQEIAAVMANLDLLVMSDTGPTHLAGALGRPVWLALSRYPDWRWMRGRADTPWYPTMRLFRQSTLGDWRGVFDNIAAELTKLTTVPSSR